VDPTGSGPCPICEIQVLSQNTVAFVCLAAGRCAKRMKPGRAVSTAAIRHWLVPCLASLVVLTSCRTSQAPPPSATATAGVTPRPAATAQVSPWDALAGRWAMIEPGYWLEIRSDGSCARHLNAVEGAFVTTEGQCELVGTVGLVITLHGEPPVEYEYLLEEPWLRLRDSDGKVWTFRKEE
jgi:hypothetical protein